MTTENLPSSDQADEPLTKAASKLQPGDRIAAGFLPLGDAADVRFVEAYTGRRSGEDWVFVVHRAGGYGPESDVFAADALVPVEHLRAATKPVEQADIDAAKFAGGWAAAAAQAYEDEADDPSGLTYTRADSDGDDPTPVSPARVPLHTGSVIDGDVLVTDETTS